MSLIPWRKGQHIVKPEEGAHPLLQMRQQIDDLFGRFFNEPWGTSLMTWPGAEAGWMPRAELSETDKEYVVRLEAPGVKSDDIEVHVSGNMLTIRGEKAEEKEEKQKNCLYCERQFGSFSRTMELPGNTDPEKVEAVFKDGVLTINIDKAPEARSRRVSVKTGG